MKGSGIVSEKTLSSNHDRIRVSCRLQLLLNSLARPGMEQGQYIDNHNIIEQKIGHK